MFNGLVTHPVTNLAQPVSLIVDLHAQVSSTGPRFYKDNVTMGHENNAPNRLDLFDTINSTIVCVVGWCKGLAEGMVWGPAGLSPDAFPS